MRFHYVYMLHSLTERERHYVGIASGLLVLVFTSTITLVASAAHNHPVTVNLLQDTGN